MGNMPYRLKSPLSAQLELTDVCNNACLHCYNYWRYLETGQRLDIDKKDRSFSHFAQLLQCLIDQEVRTVTFTGGEPFLRRDILFDLIKMAKSSGLKTGINTNGALICDDDIKKLKAVDVDYVLVSLLSNRPAVHDNIANATSHKKTSRAIARLVKSGIYVAVNMVVSVHNWQDTYETAMYVKGLGVTEFSATPVLPCPLAKGHPDIMLETVQIKKVLDDLVLARSDGMVVDVLEPVVHCVFNAEERLRFAEFLSHRSCSAGISDIVISPDGFTRPCIMAIESSGNLLTDGWETCWGNMAKWCSPDLLPSECLSCGAVDYCGGGCRIAALAKSGKINGKDPYFTKVLAESEVTVLTERLGHPIENKNILCFTGKASTRSETFGCVLFCGRRFMFLDHDGARFLNYLLQRQVFSVNSIRDDITVDTDDLKAFLSVLVDKGFLTLNSTKGGQTHEVVSEKGGYSAKCGNQAHSDHERHRSRLRKLR